MNAEQSSNGRRRTWRLRVLLVTCAAGMVLALSAWVWFSGGRPADDLAALPARPDLSGSAAILETRIARAEAWAETSDGRVRAFEELGRLYQANGYEAEAEVCWRFLREHRPEEARWSYLLAVLRLAAGEAGEAVSLLEETLERAPGYSPAVLRRADLRFKTGDLHGAAEDYRRRLTLVPGDPYARLGLVRIALHDGRSTEARRMVEELVQDTPNFATAHNLYAQLLEAEDDERARWHRWLGTETLRYVAPADPWLDELQSWCYDTTRLCVQGSVEALRENPHGAAALFARAIEIDPTALDAYRLLAGVHFENQRPAEARAVLEQARAAVTENDLTLLFTDLCRAHRELDQPEAALRIAREGLAQKPDSPELLEALGLALADLERHADAIDAYQEALTRKPNDASINYNLAVSMLASRRLDETLAALDRSLVMQPTFPPAMLMRGRLEMAAGHLAEAETYLRPVFESHRENAEARRLLAEWHWRMGTAAEQRSDAIEAERHYREGASLDSSYAEVQASLGLFLLLRSRHAEAIAPFENYRRVLPESAPGCLFLAQAYLGVGRLEEGRELLERGAELGDRSGNTRTANACREILRRL